MAATQHSTLDTQHGLFVTGTDTGVGKTLVACALLHAYAARGLRVVGMKPVAAGAEERNGALINEDVEQLIAASNVQAPRALVNPYCLRLPIAPHIAAAIEKNPIKIKYLQECYDRLRALAQVVIVEGAGGFCVPLNAGETSADLAQRLALPVVLVVGMRLGCLNHALLTAEAIRARGLMLAGWVANQVDAAMPYADDNVVALQARLDAPLLARIAHQSAPAAAAVAMTIDLEAIASSR
jgi:dethiobiotin synthetase